MKINYKLNLLIISLLVIMTVLVAGSVNFMMEQTLEEEMRDKELAIAGYVAENLANPLLNEDSLRVQEIIDDLKLRNADVRYVYVVGFDGTVVAHTFSSGFPVELVTANPITFGENSAIQILSAGAESIQDVGVRVLEGMDAKVYIGFSRAYLLECLARVTNTIIGIAALILLFGIGLTFFLTRTLTKPIEALVEGTTRVGGGDLDFQIDVASRDEIGTLTDSFNRMTADRKRAEEHIEHLNSVLKAIRDVNQVIIVEKDRDSLLQKACDVLIEARGYDAVWLGFLRDGETFATVKGSGFREDVSRFREHLLGGEHPPCFKNALAQKVPFMLVDKSIQCGDCFFKSAHTDKEVAIIRVEHAGKLFGLLAISLASIVAADEEEKGILMEVAGDIAFGLHDMEMEETRKRAEESLRQSEKRYRTLVEGAGQPIFTMNRDGVFLFMNETAADSLGGQPDDFVGKTMWDIFPKNIADLQMSNITRAIESGESLGVESESVVHGERRWYDARIHPLRNTAVEIDLALVITQDITQRKKAEERISRFSRIFEDSLNEIYLFKTDTLKFTQVNRAAQQNLGYTMEELQKMTPLDFKPEFTTESFAKLVAPLLKGETKKIVFETVHKRKDQSLYEVEVHLQLLKYEPEALFATIILDITERKQAEKELKHTALSLQEHVEKLEEAKRKITEAYRLREHFLKETSHRIITPVAIIGGHTDLLLKSNNLDEDQKEKIRVIRERNEEVQKLVRDALAENYLKVEKEEGGKK